MLIQKKKLIKIKYLNKDKNILNKKIEYIKKYKLLKKKDNKYYCINHLKKLL